MSYAYDPNKVTYFAMTDIRAQRKAFGIKQKDRDRHVYVIGKTGMGKSTLLENLAIQDIQNGEGVCFIDPHGSTAEKLLEFVPQERIDDVMYFAPFDVNYPIAFNVMEDIGYDKRHLVASGLMSAFHRIWGPETWSARMEYILQNCLLALLETPNTTLMDVNRLLSDAKFRSKVVKNVQDPIVKRYWEIEFAQYTDRYKQEAVPAIQNKIGQFVSNPLTRNIIAQPVSAFDMRTMMDERKIVIVNLSKGRIGEQNADLLGSLLVVKIYLAAMSRAELSKKSIDALPPFFLYVDEFQSVVNESFANILSEARKYKLCMTIAHQYVEQMPEEVAAAVFGNVGTTITFRIGPHDAETLEKIFEPTFTAQDIVGLGFAQIYLSLMIDGVGSRPFSAQTLGPIEEPEISYRDAILRASRNNYGTPRKEVEALINEQERGHTAEFQGNGGQQTARPAWGGDRPPREPRSDGDRRGSGDRSSPRRDDRTDRPRERRDDRPRVGASGGYSRDRDSRDVARPPQSRPPVRTEDTAPRGMGGFADIPKPQEVADTPFVGPLQKEPMPLARTAEERTSVAPPASPKAEETRDLLKAALSKYAAKEKDREEKTSVRATLPSQNNGASVPETTTPPQNDSPPARQAPPQQQRSFVQRTGHSQSPKSNTQKEQKREGEQRAVPHTPPQKTDPVTQRAPEQKQHTQHSSARGHHESRVKNDAPVTPLPTNVPVADARHEQPKHGAPPAPFATNSSPAPSSDRDIELETLRALLSDDAA